MFRDEFSPKGDIFGIETNKSEAETKAITEKLIVETKIDQIKKDLRKSGLKIRDISPTNFGTEIIFFNKADAIEASEVIGTSKVKNNSVFISD